MKRIIISVLIAAGFWLLMFAQFTELSKLIHYNYFWPAMTTATLLLTALALISEKAHLRTLFAFKWKYVWVGIVHAILLYALSRFGVWIFTELFDWAAPQIRDIYQTRTQASKYIIAPLLFFIIAPAEEIFWRGHLQKRLMDKIGVRQGTTLAIIFYTMVHVWALNPMLLLAAFVLGLHWSVMFTKFRSLIPGIVSHALWDTLIFVIFPINV